MKIDKHKLKNNKYQAGVEKLLVKIQKLKFTKSSPALFLKNSKSLISEKNKPNNSGIQKIAHSGDIFLIISIIYRV